MKYSEGGLCRRLATVEDYIRFIFVGNHQSI